MFPKNEGPADRAIRVAAGIVLIPVGLFVLTGVTGVEASAVGIGVAAIGLLSLVTGATGRCVLYIPFHINTAGSIIQHEGSLEVTREKVLR